MPIPAVLPTRFVRLAATAFLIGATASLPLSAQSNASGSTLRVGVMAGASSTTIGGKDAEDAERRTGFLAGVYLVKPIAGSLSLRPELLFSQKGAKAKFSEDDVQADVDLKLSYIDVPVLLQLEPSTTGSARPHVYAGPSFGFKSNCKLEATFRRCVGQHRLRQRLRPQVVRLGRRRRRRDRLPVRRRGGDGGGALPARLHRHRQGCHGEEPRLLAVRVDRVREAVVDSLAW